MNGMLPNLEISRMLAGHRERDVRGQVSQRSLLAAARAAGRDQALVPGPRRSRLARLHLVHHVPAVRTMPAVAVALGALLLTIGLPSGL
jgi:hypothetical protein